MPAPQIVRRVLAAVSVLLLAAIATVWMRRGPERVAAVGGVVDDSVTSDAPADRALAAAADANRPALHSVFPAGADSLLGILVTADSLLDRYAAEEYGYEERGLRVYGVMEGAYLVATQDSQRVWIPAMTRDSLIPLAQLVTERLNYLTLAWDGQLRVAPSLTAALVPTTTSWRATGPDRDETPANVRQSRVTNGQLWLEVEVRSSSGCDGDDPTVRATGWIPAWGQGRAPTAWYYSRGC